MPPTEPQAASKFPELDGKNIAINDHVEEGKQYRYFATETGVV